VTASTVELLLLLVDIFDGIAVVGRIWENLGDTNAAKCSTSKMNERQTRTMRGQRGDVGWLC
jgi:hypothetical protein